SSSIRCTAPARPPAPYASRRRAAAPSTMWSTSWAGSAPARRRAASPATATAEGADMRMQRTAGFTLVETMVAVAIAGILSSIAYPSYVGVMNKARRFDAAAAMTSLRMAQERHRANDPQYAGTLAQIRIPALSPAGHYALSI